MAELIDSLLAQTRAGAIRWTPTDVDGAFLYVAKNGSIVVSGPLTAVTSPGHVPPAAIRVTLAIQAMDWQGDKVEQFTVPVGADVEYAPLRSLFEEIANRTSEGSPLLEALRQEVEAAR